MSSFPQRHAEIRPQMLPASVAERQRRAGQASWPQARPAADSHSYRRADLMWDDHSPACPKCGDLCSPRHQDCPACGAQLYPSQSSEAIAATARDTAIASPNPEG